MINMSVVSIVKKIILAIVISLYLNSCGIASVPVLKEVSLTIPFRSVFAIEHSTENATDSFLGYNVYYKLYDAANITTIASDKSYITDSTRNPTPSIITSRGFRQFVPTTFNGVSFSSFNDDASDILLSPRPKTSSKTYYIDFSGGINVGTGNTSYDVPGNVNSYISGIGFNRGLHAILIDGTSTTILQRRTSGNNFLPFFNTTGSYTYNLKDADIASMVPTFSTGKDLVVVIAVIPYGIDFVNVQRIYGTIKVSSSTTFDYTRRPN